MAPRRKRPLKMSDPLPATPPHIETPFSRKQKMQAAGDQASARLDAMRSGANQFFTHVPDQFGAVAQHAPEFPRPSPAPRTDPRLTDPGKVEGLAQGFVDTPPQAGGVSTADQFAALQSAAKQSQRLQGGGGPQTQFLAGAKQLNKIPGFEDVRRETLVSGDSAAQLAAFRQAPKPRERGFIERVAGMGDTRGDKISRARRQVAKLSDNDLEARIDRFSSESSDLLPSDAQRRGLLLLQEEQGKRQGKRQGDAAADPRDKELARLQKKAEQTNPFLKGSVSERRRTSEIEQAKGRIEEIQGERQRETQAAEARDFELKRLDAEARVRTDPVEAAGKVEADLAEKEREFKRTETVLDRASAETIAKIREQGKQKGGLSVEDQLVMVEVEFLQDGIENLEKSAAAAAQGGGTAAIATSRRLLARAEELREQAQTLITSRRQGGEQGADDAERKERDRVDQASRALERHKHLVAQGQQGILTPSEVLEALQAIADFKAKLKPQNTGA